MGVSGGFSSALSVFGLCLLVPGLQDFCSKLFSIGSPSCLATRPNLSKGSSAKPANLAALALKTEVPPKKRRCFFCCSCFGKSRSVDDEIFQPKSHVQSLLPPASQSVDVARPPPIEGFILPPILPEDVGKKTLVLDLDETLVHSSFKPMSNADFVISVEIEEHTHLIYVAKRPGVDHFLERLSSCYEIVVFTASLAKYANPLLDLLDPRHMVRTRLFRESCCWHEGNYVKDLSNMGRDMRSIIIIDNSPASYIFQPQNAIPVTSWYAVEPGDRALYDLLPFLEALAQANDVTACLTSEEAWEDPVWRSKVTELRQLQQFQIQQQQMMLAQQQIALAQQQAQYIAQQQLQMLQQQQQQSMAMVPVVHQHGVGPPATSSAAAGTTHFFPNPASASNAATPTPPSATSSRAASPQPPLPPSPTASSAGAAAPRATPGPAVTVPTTAYSGPSLARASSIPLGGPPASAPPP
ncbi:putative Carboxy-terminal domain RNA polymerase II polypeptide A small phosphatase 1 [Paratrimastix pyriformis]|uniref:Carboxy-terminal domain RNA polymerase II polypeptide A small phosphatase 1 n=1 Tax=Paratrimastix pyriformis TaxID=342808 RepID=A0ABQ8UQV5_9EUKA|nr:putative Carboxy-terminal domain RNA polymerase II polypeptide A small phosphatase 1 [Paratrimastix pyriformis]